jgi:LacI family transcriptional regulator
VTSSRNQPVTIAAVADEAGVAMSTVSRVLNGGHASDDARRRVERAVKKLAYVPSHTARSFAAGRSGAVGLVVEDISGEWLTEILAGIEFEIRRRQTTLLIGSLGDGQNYDQSSVLEWINHRRVDGLIFARARRREKPLIEAATKQGIALALIAPDEDFGAGKVVSSGNQQAGRDAGRHLAALGHRVVSFVGGPRESVDSRLRLAGLREGLGEAGVTLPDDRVVFAPHYNVNEGRNFAAAWRKQKSPATAVVFGNDAMALGFMSVLLNEGLQIPRDVSVVGFDDVAAAALVFPGLTTARQESRKMGTTAFTSLIRQIEAPRYEDEQPVDFPMTLVVRKSTGPVRGSPS